MASYWRGVLSFSLVVLACQKEESSQPLRDKETPPHQPHPKKDRKCAAMKRPRLTTARLVDSKGKGKGRQRGPYRSWSHESLSCRVKDECGWIMNQTIQCLIPTTPWLRDSELPFVHSFIKSNATAEEWGFEIEMNLKEAPPLAGLSSMPATG